MAAPNKRTVLLVTLMRNQAAPDIDEAGVAQNRRPVLLGCSGVL